MDFLTFLQKSRTALDTELDRLFFELNSEVTTLSPQLTESIAHFQTACADGKRIRGALIALGYLIAQKKASWEDIPSSLFSVGAAYEIFQTAILAHDDIIDRSPKRRGKPSLYARYGGDHGGISQALCVGDIGFFLTFKLFSESNFPANNKMRALNFFSNAVSLTALGELLDVKLTLSKTETVEDILTVYRLKTAYYTIIAPLTIGALLGRGSAAVLKSIARYGDGVGIAYQIQDDIIDIWGSKDRTQKELGGDIREGKETLVYCLARNAAKPEQQALLTQYYGNPDITDFEIGQVRNIFQETGALAESRKIAEQKSQEAKQVIANITPDNTLQQILRDMTDFFLEKTQ